jgi:hypothetical protein
MATEARKYRLPSGDLGGLVSEFRGRITVFPWLIIGALAGFTAGHSGSGVAVIVGVIVGVIVAVGFFLLARDRARKLNVKVHSEGLVYQAKGRKSEVWRWNDVEEFFVLAEKREIHSPPHNIAEALISGLLEAAVTASLPKAAKYRVRYKLRRPGNELVLDSFIRDYRRLGEIVENFVTTSRLPLVLASFRGGHTIPFGKLLLGPEGLTDARPEHPRFLPLHALASVSASKYVVAVNQAGEKAAWTSAEASAVPNAAILAALVEHVVAERVMP